MRVRRGGDSDQADAGVVGEYLFQINGRKRNAQRRCALRGPFAVPADDGAHLKSCIAQRSDMREKPKARAYGASLPVISFLLPF
jgi:hypothetical protein